MINRRTARELALHMIFELGFRDGPAEAMLNDYLTDKQAALWADECEMYRELPEGAQLDYIKRVVSGVDEHMAELDRYIETYANNWKFGRISRISAAIMRLSMYELMYCDDIPNASSINEAVELAKKYDSDEAASFVNGVLGAYARKELL